MVMCQQKLIASVKMENMNKTKEQLIEEIEALNRRVAELEKSEAEREQAEERIVHLNAVLRALRSVNQLIVKVKDRGRLLQGICDNLIESRGYNSAWIALLEENGRFLTAAQAGIEKGFPVMVDNLKCGEMTPCIQQAVKQSGVVVVANPVVECGDCSLVGTYAGKARMMARLEYEGYVYGFLTVTVPVEMALDEEERSLFSEVADDIAFALQTIKRETKRKLAEEALKKSESTLAEAQHMAHIGSWELDLVSNTLTWSDEVYRMFGLKPQQFRATYEAFLDNIHPHDREMVNKAYAESVSNKTPYNIVHRLLLKDGTVKYVNERCETFYDDGKPIRSIGTVQDITERKQMEKQLIVTDRLASVGELASGIAHELNNPLTGVIGFSQLLLDKDVSDDVKEDLRIISSEAQRAAQVVKGLLAFARKHAPVKQLVNINSIIDKVLELRAYEQKVSNIQANTRFAPDLPEVMADYFQLQQVFLNIIINAEHFMIEAHGKGTLTIATEKVGDIITASFTDDGPGISREDLVHVFDPFFTTKEVGKGTGLGLSICHGITTEHGGRIYTDSELGKGATFIVELPITEH